MAYPQDLFSKVETSEDGGDPGPEFVLHSISSAAADSLRDRGGPIYLADENPGYPCRQCLRDADVGEELILVSHNPFTTNSQYRSASPIFLHRLACEPPNDPTHLPQQLTQRQLSVRSFDQDEMMIDAAVIDGQELAHTIQGFFENATSEQIHVHNATRGCWAVTVERG